uniref:RNA-directed DNA polymerase n=1 Tax=Strongyloides papillosus TaxID=174720 RepID=A0A0N5B3X7_STREA
MGHPVYEDAFPIMKDIRDKPFEISQFAKFLDDQEKAILQDDGIMITIKGKSRVYVPRVLRDELLRRFHEHPDIGQHWGYAKLADKFCLIFYWPKMAKDMQRVWQDCEVCWRTKHQPSNLVQTNTHSIPRPAEVWETLNADYIQLEDKLHVLVIIDEYSRFAYTAITKKQDQHSTLVQLMKCFSTFGYPRTLRTDGGASFIGNKVEKYLQTMHIKHYISSPHNHKSNAFVERFNRTIRESLRAQTELTPIETVYALTYAYNRTKHMSTGYPPSYFVLNTADRVLTDIPMHGIASGLMDVLKYGMEKYSDTPTSVSRQGKHLLPGHIVMKRVMHKKLSDTSHKNQDQFDGPYTVISHVHGDTFIIRRCTKAGRLTGKEERVTADRLKIVPVHPS